MKHIFLVEDDREIAGNLTLLLKAEGFAVTHASTQAEAVSALTDSSRTESVKETDSIFKFKVKKKENRVRNVPIRIRCFGCCFGRRRIC